MPGTPQPAPYRPDPAILSVADWLGDPVLPARFPQAIPRFRNDRWASAVGLDGLSDTEWVDRFARFTPLPDNLPQPLALRYHGHQFQVYNPDLGDGRGFLFAQIRDGADRLLDLGTKGSGTTPWSRTADGRLTLKGAVREILATELLEALGVNTSKTFSVIETGEALIRGDEPSPTRSAVLVRLSHGHIRIGSFQRLSALGEHDHLAELVDYCLTRFPGGEPPTDAPGRALPAVRLLHQVIARLADMAASYMAAGFVHGVLNSDNMNVTGESFDYGPWRFAPGWQPGFTAAYFDRNGLYAFARQGHAIHWNCLQLAIALSPLVPDGATLQAALDRFPPLYHAALGRRFAWRLGFTPDDEAAGEALMVAVERELIDSRAEPAAWFFAHRAGRDAQGSLAEALTRCTPLPGEPDPWWNEAAPESLLIDEVETLWSAIAERDDWEPLYAKINRIRRAGLAHGESPEPVNG